MLKKMNPRYWSNIELKKMGHFFTGEIINVSGWVDKDKEGNFYKDYFSNADKYYVSNYGVDKERGINNGVKTDFIINLNENLSKEMIGKFDVVFNHTVLEHVVNPVKVFENLSLMSKDVLIIVVPFKQKFHFSPDNYGDYYRFSPMAMRKMFEKNGFDILYESYTPPPAIDVYLFYIGTKHKEKWQGVFDTNLLNLVLLNKRMGMNDYKILYKNIFYNIIQKLKNRYMNVK